MRLKLQLVDLQLQPHSNYNIENFEPKQAPTIYWKYELSQQHGNPRWGKVLNINEQQRNYYMLKIKLNNITT